MLWWFISIFKPISQKLKKKQLQEKQILPHNWNETTSAGTQEFGLIYGQLGQGKHCSLERSTQTTVFSLLKWHTWFCCEPWALLGLHSPLVCVLEILESTESPFGGKVWREGVEGHQPGATETANPVVSLFPWIPKWFFLEITAGPHPQIRWNNPAKQPSASLLSSLLFQKEQQVLPSFLPTLFLEHLQPELSSPSLTLHLMCFSLLPNTFSSSRNVLVDTRHLLTTGQKALQHKENILWIRQT